jgi:hypothetical protein
MDKIYDYENGRFFARYRDIVRFDLEIRMPITQVYGQSATGKTLLVNFIRNEKKNDKYNPTTTIASNVEVFDDGVTIEDLTKIKNALIVIDRGDLILTPKVIEWIGQDKNNHYLIFSRTSLPLGLSPNYYGEFVCDENNVISISYKYSEVNWF